MLKSLKVANYPEQFEIGREVFVRFCDLPGWHFFNGIIMRKVYEVHVTKDGETKRPPKIIISNGKEEIESSSYSDFYIPEWEE
jgi:hypothetical protein